MRGRPYSIQSFFHPDIRPKLTVPVRECLDTGNFVITELLIEAMRRFVESEHT